MTTALYAIAPVSALLGAVIGALLSGRASRRALDRQLEHEDARARAERFLDLRRDLYARVVSNFHELGDLRYNRAGLEAQLAALGVLPDNPGSTVADLEATPDQGESRRAAKQQVALAKQHSSLMLKQHYALMLEYDSTVSNQLAQTKVFRSFIGELTLVSPRFVYEALRRLMTGEVDDALVLFVRAARWDLEGHNPTEAELAVLSGDDTN